MVALKYWTGSAWVAVGGAGITLPLTQTLTFAPDNTYDIGASAANRARIIYAGTSVVTPLLDTPLLAPASNVIEQRNGTNVQLLQIYRTYTDAANYERLRVGFVTSAAYIYAEAAGTGAGRQLVLGTQAATNLVFMTSGLTRWLMNASGTLLANTDNTFDIGQSGANRPRVIYTGGRIVSGGSVVPATSGGPSLGENAERWNSLFLSNTIYANSWEMIGTPKMYGPMRQDPTNQFSINTAWANESTWLNVVPNGTAVMAVFRAFNKSSDLANASYMSAGVDGTTAWLESNRLGTASYLPLTFYTSQYERLRINANGNVVFPGTGQRIMGDFSNGVAANRPMFQSTGAGWTAVGLMPGVGGSGSYFELYSSTDPANSPLLQLGSAASSANISVTQGGTGGFLPLSINVGGAERMRIETNGQVAMAGGLNMVGTPLQNFWWNGNGNVDLGNANTLLNQIRVIKAWGGSANVYFSGSTGMLIGGGGTANPHVMANGECYIFMAQQGYWWAIAKGH